MKVISAFSFLCFQKTKTMTRTCPTPKWTLTSGVRRPGRRNASPWRSSLMSWRNITATNSSSPTETSFQPEVRAVNVLIPDCHHGDGCSQILAARIVSRCCSPSRARPQPADCTACRGEGGEESQSSEQISIIFQLQQCKIYLKYAKIHLRARNLRSCTRADHLHLGRLI